MSVYFSLQLQFRVNIANMKIIDKPFETSGYSLCETFYNRYTSL